MTSEIDPGTQSDKFVLIEFHVVRFSDSEQVRRKFCGHGFGELPCIAVVHGGIHNRDGRFRGHSDVLSMPRAMRKQVPGV